MDDDTMKEGAASMWRAINAVTQDRSVTNAMTRKSMGYTYDGGTVTVIDPILFEKEMNERISFVDDDHEAD